MSALEHDRAARRAISCRAGCGACSIHPDRPLVCREYHVTTPAANCARLYQAQIDRVDPALRLGEVLARTDAKLTSGETFMIPLALSLE